jgi:hypothetical protein
VTNTGATGCSDGSYLGDAAAGVVVRGAGIMGAEIGLEYALRLPQRADAPRSATRGSCLGEPCC